MIDHPAVITNNSERNGRESIFDGVGFYVLPVYGGEEIHHNELGSLLKSQGGTLCPIPSDDSVNTIILPINHPNPRHGYTLPLNPDCRWEDPSTLDHNNLWSAELLVRYFEETVRDGEVCERRKVVVSSEWVYACLSERRYLGEEGNWGGWRIKGSYDIWSKPDIGGIRVESIPFQYDYKTSYHHQQSVQPCQHRQSQFAQDMQVQEYNKLNIHPSQSRSVTLPLSLPSSVQHSLTESTGLRSPRTAYQNLPAHERVNGISASERPGRHHQYTLPLHQRLSPYPTSQQQNGQRHQQHNALVMNTLVTPHNQQVPPRDVPSLQNMSSSHQQPLNHESHSMSWKYQNISSGSQPVNNLRPTGERIPSTHALPSPLPTQINHLPPSYIQRTMLSFLKAPPPHRLISPHSQNGVNNICDTPSPPSPGQTIRFAHPTTREPQSSVRNTNSPIRSNASVDQSQSFAAPLRSATEATSHFATAPNQSQQASIHQSLIIPQPLLSNAEGKSWSSCKPLERSDKIQGPMFLDTSGHPLKLCIYSDVDKPLRDFIQKKGGQICNRKDASIIVLHRNKQDSQPFRPKSQREFNRNITSFERGQMIVIDQWLRDCMEQSRLTDTRLYRVWFKRTEDTGITKSQSPKPVQPTQQVGAIGRSDESNPVVQPSTAGKDIAITGGIPYNQLQRSVSSGTELPQQTVTPTASGMPNPATTGAPVSDKIDTTKSVNPTKLQGDSTLVDELLLSLTEPEENDRSSSQAEIHPVEEEGEEEVVKFTEEDLTSLKKFLEEKCGQS
ncbi:uncharacterized protein IL334_006928 [Kwoniella shivajii]|uniref:BRCT domain-containing protein n=1 Tax=Kwoniella shivajii TaxID=564305 RepID=A0ABZ1D7D2_9TREE|nr:hypothetical protein IL334_006928 [Kwoniella shivajii]